MTAIIHKLCLISCLTLPVVSACDSSPDPKPSADRDSGKSGEDAGDHADHDAGPSDVGPARAQASRMFTVDQTMLAFDAIAGSTLETDRWSGVLDGAGYRIEVPKNWNGFLVMYAHGYVGAVPALRITLPSIRKHLIEQGYAWAASSYSTNYYDVRSGVEDTNKLALAFKRIAADNGRTLSEPTKYYLIGHSMGGHITGAAIEKEASTTAINKVNYKGAVPMCGVMGDTELFNYFTAYQHAAQKLAGVPSPVTDFPSVRMQIQDALFSTYPTATTPAGDKVKAIVRNLTGGARPMFDAGFAVKGLQDAVWSTFGGDGTINGILTKRVLDTRNTVFQLDDDPAQSAEEKTFNAEVERATPDADANGLRKDGLRWIPQVNGEFSIPVVTLHTLGDLYVPFKMEQIYRERATAKGSGAWLVQRAIRGTSHCEFTYAEQVDAFEAMINWEQKGIKPEGDDVLDPRLVSSPSYGCKFTNNAFTPEEMPPTGMVPTARAAVPACPATP
jgi:pimeloyl-ACP methyl ester carboxylesterase